MSTLKIGLASASTVIVVALSAFIYADTGIKHAPTIGGPGIPRSQFSSKGVVNRIIQVQMTHDEVNNHAEKNTLRVRLNMPFDFRAPLNYRWKLGEGVELKEGALSGELSQLLKDDSTNLSIVVTGFSKESNRHVAFEIYGLQNGRAISGDMLLASDPENTFEDIVQNVERIKSSPLQSSH